ncbi:MAG: hypothetical protein GY749_40850 [Desulfobacteraceae bacterium]|nr:hypothetical protein [Desulfobacteraceae bacterium]
MNVEILKDVFENASNEEGLNKLLHVIEGQHQLYLKDNTSELRDSKWFNNLRQTDKDIIGDSIIRTLQILPSSTPDVTISESKTQNVFSLKEAYYYLKQPFVILLENSYNDSHFLNSLLRNFPKQGEEISAHKKERWVQYRMGGGTTIPDVIKSEIDSFSQNIFSKEKHKYLRYFVLMDSDKKYPDMELEPQKVNLIEFLKEKEIPYHILEKREMENYLPDEALSEINDNKDFIEAYLRLKPVQKDYFDLQKGFADKNFDQLRPDEIKVFFDDVSEEGKKIFRKKNLKKINKSQTENFKSEFPKLFLHKKVNKATLLKRTSHQKNPEELREILKKISMLL